MTYSPFTATGNGSTTAYSIAFDYINTSDVKAKVNNVVTTAFSVSGSTVTFTTAPPSGQSIEIYRTTDNATIQADFQSGSALRAVDLNDNFTQLLYVTQESTDTSNEANTDAAAAVTTANTASTNATTAVNTANAATTTANSATTTANGAVTTANSAVTTANAATTTANTASTNATNAVNTANTASTNATNAVNTANTASTNASSAVTTANTASTNASNAVTTANSATSTANAASAAVANAVLYDPVANVAAIPGSPSNGDYIELNDSTGIQSFSPLSGMPAGFIGDSGLVVRLKYVTSPSSTWQWQNYFAKDSETRYLKDNAAQIVDADINASAAIGLSKLATGALPTAITVTSANISDLSIVNADVNASAAIAGTKISPDFGSQNVITTGSVGIGTSSPSSYNASADNLVVQNDGGTGAAGMTIRAGTGSQSTIYFADGTGASDAIRGYVQYFHNGDFLRFGTDANERVRITSDGKLGVADSAPNFKLDVNGDIGIREDNNLIFHDGSGTAAFRIRGDSSNKLHFERASGHEAQMIIDDGRLLVGTTSAGSNGTADDLVVANDGSASDQAGITIRGGTSGRSQIFFSDGTSGDAEYRGMLRYDHSEDSMQFRTLSDERMRLDSSGRLGLGTQNPTSALYIDNATNAYVLQNRTNCQSIIGPSGPNESDGVLVGSVTNSPFIFWVNSGDKGRIDSDGRLILGTSTEATNAEVTVRAAAPQLSLYATPGNISRITLGDTDDYNIGELGYDNSDNSMFFSTNNATRMSIDSSGQVKAQGGKLYVQTSGSGTGDTDGVALIVDGNADAYLWNYENTTLRFGTNNTERMRIGSAGRQTIFNGDSYNVVIRSSNSASTSNHFLACTPGSSGIDNGGTGVTFQIFTNGNVQNTNDSYGGISDVKLKENIVDAGSQWDDFKAVKFRKYNFKEETGLETHTQLGVIAQELELTSPGLVYETADKDEDGNDLGTTTKAVKSSILTKKALVALQEAMARIETLEAEVAALKSA